MGKTTNFDLEKAAEQRKAEMKDITRGLGMCHQRADNSFLYKKALLATLRRRALTPSKMVPREAGNQNRKLVFI